LLRPPEGRASPAPTSEEKDSGISAEKNSKYNLTKDIIEQSKDPQFGAEAIHNSLNVVEVPKSINQWLADYYSSKQSYTEGLVVREWLKQKLISTHMSLI
jgi:hypothetical protein